MIINDKLVYDDRIHIPFRYYKNDSNCPMLIFFSAFTMQLSTWNFIYHNEAINKKYNLLFFEHRGQVNATKYFSKDEEYTVSENTIYLYEILSKLGLQNNKLHLIALSSGAPLLVDFTLKYPEKVKSIFLMGPFLYVDEATEKKENAIINIANCISSDKHDYVIDLFFYDWFSYYCHDYSSIISFHREFLSALFKNDAQFFTSAIKIRKFIFDYCMSFDAFSKELRDLGIPTKIVTGDMDRTVVPESVNTIASKINAEVQFLRGFGHLWFLLDNSDLLNSILINFIDKIEGTFSDKRNEKRRELSLPARIELNKELQANGYIINWSCKGRLFEINNFDKNINIVDWENAIGYDVLVHSHYPCKKTQEYKISWVKKQRIYIHIGLKMLRNE